MKLSARLTNRSNNADAFSRRDFIKTALVGAGWLATGPNWLTGAEAGAPSFKGTDLVPLGRTGLKVSRLAQGTGYNGYNRSSAHTRAGKAAFERLLRHSIDRGITFIDMADLYGSHPFVRDVIKGMDRSKLVLLTKIWPRKEKWVTPSGGAREEIDRFRQELGTDMIDVCLIHCMLNDRWPAEYAGIRDGLSELKAQGIVRAVGVSCHDFGALKQAAEHPWVDVIFARINHKGGAAYACDAAVEEVSAVLKTARKNGKAVVGMKIFGAGKLTKPQDKDASLAYVFTNGLVDAITVGMLTPEEVDDTLERMARVGRG
jgi:aryl-alcohol dehydrogenase-like predicted oxidoreductase